MLNKNKTEKKLDKRIQKTKKNIFDSTIELLCHKELSKITVTELCQLANINRKTFYTHFNTPYDAFNESIENFTRSFTESVEELAKDTDILSPSLVLLLLEAFVESEEKIPKLLQSPNQFLFYEKLTSSLTDIFYNGLTQESIYDSINNVQKRFISKLFAGSTISVYYEHLKNPKNSNLNEISDLLSTILMQGLKSLTDS